MKGNENIPEEVQTLVNNYDNTSEDPTRCMRLQIKLQKKGYTCDFFLNGVICNLRKHIRDDTRYSN